jgi:hypothetical protein
MTERISALVKEPLLALLDLLRGIFLSFRPFASRPFANQGHNENSEQTQPRQQYTDELVRDDETSSGMKNRLRSSDGLSVWEHAASSSFNPNERRAPGCGLRTPSARPKLTASTRLGNPSVLNSLVK